VVDDAINLGSATIATAGALRAAGCTVAGVGSALVCAPAGLEVGARLGVAQVFLERVDTAVWAAVDCPVCAAGQRA
jgi:orotate phosphoribosyltransferase